MANDLKVTLNENTNPWLVDIDQKDNANQVARSALAQTITWQLNGNAANGTIVNFVWINSPPAGVFGDPSYGVNGKSMTMSDLNNSAATAGQWIYKLEIQVNGNTYWSGATAITGTATNPSIKNN